MYLDYVTPLHNDSLGLVANELERMTRSSLAVRFLISTHVNTSPLDSSEQAACRLCRAMCASISCLINDDNSSE
jgi:hypothetical protein